MLDRAVGCIAALALVIAGCGDSNADFGKDLGTGGAGGSSNAGSGGNGNGGGQSGGNGGTAGGSNGGTAGGAGTGSVGEGCGPIGTCEGEWVRQFGGLPDQDDTAYGVAIDPSGNAIMGGTIDVAALGSGTGVTDDFIRVYASSGEEVSHRELTNNAGSEHLRGLRRDPQGNIFIAGTLTGLLDGQGSSTAVSIYVRKLTSTGSPTWTRVFLTHGQDIVHELDLGPDGSAFIAGVVSGVLPGQVGGGGTDAFVRKYDTNGNEAWTRQFTLDGADYGYAVSVDASGNAYMGGHVAQGMPGFDTKPGDVDGFVRKYSATGEELWTVPIATDARDVVYSIAADIEGSILVTGTTDGAFPGSSSAGSTDVFVTKLTTDGTAIWTRQFGSSRPERPRAIALDALGDVYVAGDTFGSLNSEPDEATRGFVAKLTSDGSLTWIRQLTPSEPQGLAEIYDIAIGAGEAFVVGRVRGSLPGQTGVENFDAFIARMLL